MGRAGGWRRGIGPALLGCVLLPAALLLGCAKSAGPIPQSIAQDHLAKLKNLYLFYVERNQKGPPSEEALREFGQKLTPTERSDRSIGDDLEGIFMSPRDKQKFTVQYNVKANPSRNQALAWEATGQNGMRFVALSMGYVVEYDEKTLNEVKK